MYHLNLNLWENRRNKMVWNGRITIAANFGPCLRPGGKLISAHGFGPRHRSTVHLVELGDNIGNFEPVIKFSQQPNFINVTFCISFINDESFYPCYSTWFINKLIFFRINMLRFYWILTSAESLLTHLDH